MLLKIISALLAAITIYQFITSICAKKLTFNKIVSFLFLLIVCFFIYHTSDGTNEPKTESDVHSSSAETHTAPSLSNDQSDDLSISSNEPVSSTESAFETSSLSEENDNLLEEQTNPGTPFVEVTPNNQITRADLYTWDQENDRDIIGNTYPAAIKLMVSNTVDVLFGYGESNITANVHFPFGEKAEGAWIFRFVASQEMAGNGSSAKITILADGRELYPAFTLTSSTTEDLAYKIPLDGIRDLVLRFECISVGSGFCAGIVLDDSAE